MNGTNVNVFTIKLTANIGVSIIAYKPAISQFLPKTKPNAGFTVKNITVKIGIDIIRDSGRWGILSSRCEGFEAGAAAVRESCCRI
jgi:hypothetical protein